MGGLKMLLSVVIWISLIGAPPVMSKSETLGGDFSLVDQDGQPFHLQQVRGKVVLLFFGYTYCPDICPTELSQMSVVLNGLEEDAERVQGIFVSVDPERDKPQVLKRYLAYFNETLVGLTGTSESIKRVAEQYHARFKKHHYASGGYAMDHSASLYVLDQEGTLSTVVPYGLPPLHVINVVKHLLARE